MIKDDFTVTVLNAVPLVTADVYSYIFPVRQAKEVNIQVGNLAGNTPVGVWKFDMSNDPQTEADFWTEQQTGTRLGTSSTAKWVPVDDPTVVQGDSLTLAANAVQNSQVAFVLGLGAFMRVWYDITSGGNSSSVGTVRATVKG